MAVLAGMIVSLSAAEFAPPAEGPVAFRRDRIPLDVDAMAGLSRHLGILARGLDARTAAERRGAAQMLALALALNPGNTRARELISAYEKSRHTPEGNASRLETSRAALWLAIQWLETPAAGADGQALAACLKDVVVISDPKHPGAGAWQEQGGAGNWAGWIPPPGAYQERDVIKREPRNRVLEAAPPATRIAPLEQAEVRTILWRRVPKGEVSDWVRAPQPLRMIAKRRVGNDAEMPGFSLNIGNDANFGAFDVLGNTLKSLLRKQHGKLPEGVRIRITSEEFEASLQSGRRQSISGAAAVLASSAVTGREPAATIIGQIDEAGVFGLPTDFWDQLSSLGKGKGQRLVLPADAAAYLPSMLALERPEFFLEYEVFLAADFGELLEASGKVLEGPMAAASVKFREIHERAEGLDLRSYLANGFVKQRLVAVCQDFPSHVSSGMLLLQATGKRPTLVSRQVLASELRQALAPIRTLRSPEAAIADSNASGGAGVIYESCRTKLDGLERYVAREDQELLEQAREVVLIVRDLDKVSRSRGEEWEIEGALWKAIGNLSRAEAAFAERLAIEVKGNENSAPGGSR